MIYLLLSILANIAMTFVMRYSESHTGNRYAVTMFNYLTGVVVSFLLLKNKTLFFPTGAGKFAIELAFLNAFLFVSCLLLIQYCIQKNGAPMTTTFNRLGILIPTVLSAFLFKEIPEPLQMVGLGLAVFAIVFINGGRGGEKRKKSMTGLILIFVIGGFIDFNAKIFGHFGDGALQEHYIFYTFVFSFLLSILLLLKQNRKITKQDFISGILVGIPNQLTTLCLLKAVAVLPAFMVFPVYSAAVILSVNIINRIVFKEVLTRRQTIGTGIIAMALVFINL